MLIYSAISPTFVIGIKKDNEIKNKALNRNQQDETINYRAGQIRQSNKQSHFQRWSKDPDHYIPGGQNLN